jgi:hypothetical protein
VSLAHLTLSARDMGATVELNLVEAVDFKPLPFEVEFGASRSDVAPAASRCG